MLCIRLLQYLFSTGPNPIYLFTASTEYQKKVQEQLHLLKRLVSCIIRISQASGQIVVKRMDLEIL
jgi:hypothetical protein